MKELINSEYYVGFIIVRSEFCCTKNMHTFSVPFECLFMTSFTILRI